MARIRTIKPEFPQSESMGRISRDARLLFVELWTICDDEGRTRAASRMLASLLFPYDDDAPELIEGWLTELEREGCIVRFIADGSTYLQVLNWLNHQKIDKPSRSKIPSFDESSRMLSKPRECSSVDLRTKDQGVDHGSNPLVASDADDQGSVEAIPGIPNCPQQKLLALYAELLPTLTQPRVWEGARADAMRARWRQCAVPSAVSKGYTTEDEGLRYWRKFFDYVAKSQKLVNGIPRADGSPWQPDLEWLMKAGNFAKVVEGKYHEVAA